MTQCTALLPPGQAAGAMVDAGFVADLIVLWRTLLVLHNEHTTVTQPAPFAEPAQKNYDKVELPRPYRLLASCELESAPWANELSLYAERLTAAASKCVCV